MITEPVSVKEMQEVLNSADLIHDQQAVECAITQVALAITQKLSEANPLVFTVMNGGIVFSGKLLTQLNFPLEASYLHVTRYNNTTSGGKLNWKVKPSQNLRDRSILIVDDILDEGRTLAEIINYCKAMGATRVWTSILINKIHNRKANPDFTPDFLGMSVEDRYIFGYGLDYKGYWRNAAGIYAIKN